VTNSLRSPGDFAPCAVTGAEPAGGHYRLAMASAETRAQTEVPSFYMECAPCGKFRDVPRLPPEVGLG